MIRSGAAEVLQSSLSLCHRDELGGIGHKCGIKSGWRWWVCTHEGAVMHCLQDNALVSCLDSLLLHCHKWLPSMLDRLVWVTGRASGP